jgi:ribose 5-phosphate isomerase A
LVAKKIISLGGQPVLRENYITDNGNLILDAYNLRIDNPIFIENKINQVPGVVTVGIFANRSADILLVSDGLKVRSI